MPNSKIKIFFNIAQFIFTFISAVMIYQSQAAIIEKVSSIDVLFIIGIFMVIDWVKNTGVNIMDYRKWLKENKIK